jgi:hypothetical protein
MSFDAGEFFTEVTKDVEVDDETKAAIDKVKTAILANEKFSQNLEGTTLRQSDYSKKLSEMTKKVDIVNKFHSDLKDWEARTSESLASREARLKAGSAYEPDDSFGVGDPSEPKSTIDTSGLVSATDLDQRLGQLEGNALDIVAQVNEYSMDHYIQFGERLPNGGKDLFRVAMEQGVSLPEAYRQFIEPKLDKKREEDLTTRIEKEREDAVKEFQANSNFPAQPIVSKTPRAADMLEMEADKRPALGWKAASEAYADR